jgi:anion-transporting  ArsA/GET3 family ATPase
VSGASGIASILGTARVVLTTGPGGVGKTTIAASLAMAAAGQGRRVVVVTIDPAKRLADALGLDALSDDPSPVPGEWEGELSALMLDTRSTFDGLVRRFATSPADAEAIMANPFYRNIAGTLSGTQEYMATEKLHALAEDDRFDLVVVDTPPSRHALDFLDAPRRLVRFLDHRLYRLLTAPGRKVAKAFSLATRPFLWTVRKVAGPEVVEDAIAFFRAFEGMEEGFRERARAVAALLLDETTVFTVCTSPRHEAVLEADHLAVTLRERGFRLGAVIVNLGHPSLAPLATDGVEAPAGSDLAALLANHRMLRGLAAAEEEATARLVATAGDVAVVRLPLLGDDVHDLDALAGLAARLGATGAEAAPQ